MPIDSADLPEPTDEAVQPQEGEPAAKPRIAEWVTELPRPRRTTDFDAVIDQIRAEGQPDQWARLESGNGKAITPNKISSLKKRYTDIDFKQVRGETYAAKKQA